jgi:DNA (cytosine-5)-methyltransferase 3A
MCWSKIITKTLGVHPIEINSNLVSAQNRRRLYWTNIGLKPAGLFGDLESIIKQPKDKGILLKDILESDVDEKYFLSEKLISYFEKNSEKQKQKGNGFIFKPVDLESKEKTLTLKAGSRMDDNFIIHNLQKRSPDRPSLKNNPNAGGSGHLSRQDGKTYCLDTACGQAVEIKCEDFRWRENGKSATLDTSNLPIVKYKVLNENQLKKFNPNIDANKSNTLTLAHSRAGSSDEYMDSVSKIAKLTSNIRRLTPIECERLQTMKDNYTNHVSDTQRYKMLGNGWTIEVIKHIFLYIE